MKAWNDKMILTDVITQLKYLLDKYNVALQESSCPKMRALVTKLSNKTADAQFGVFEYMNKNGMYPIQNAEPTKVKQVITQHKGSTCGCG